MMGGMKLAALVLDIYGMDLVSLPDLFRPRRDEFTEPVTPDILVDCNGNKQRSCNGLVRVDRVSADDTRECRDLDASARVSDYDNDLPRPLALVADRDDNVTDKHDNDVRYHGWQSHLGLTNAIVSPCASRRNPIAKRPSSGKAEESTDHDGTVGKAYHHGFHMVRGSGKHLALRKIDGEKT